ncbi:hypothetical protein MT356_20270 [Rathayibacter festucae]|jgi:hypothetical protein|uniref:hypothetical protein n=1 Tax=Rathayibacter TaxID=33886 RepID=UPI000CE7475F|nr:MULTISPECIES: hypothetical protein [Rathayibacter]MCJ1702053.1 hypothetical protein [Rathayibacter festucae]PPG64407.1 hypothetical protein C5C27_03325 [Rathayibacter sp. AY2B7]QHC68748.1 hypothetical protein GSU68_18765 [Rathayibacter sp. VKM Ac-2759]
MAETEERDADGLLRQLVASVSAIPDPIERASECVRVGEEVRGLHSQLAAVRRKAIYEATLKPGATGRSVAAELGVSAKTVSQASAEYRRTDLEMLRDLVLAAKVGSQEDPDVAHAEAMLASTTAVGVLAHVVAKLSGHWYRAADFDSDDDHWWKIHDGFERAQYLSGLAGLERSRPATVDAAEQDDPHTPAVLRWPCRLLNAMPGIRAHATTDERRGRPVWTLWWNIKSADSHVDIFSAGPSGDGWLVTEWLVWLVRDYRIAGRTIASTVTAPPPMLNEPGNMLTFTIEAPLDGEDAVDPREFGRSIVRLWGGAASDRDRTGYFEINWPPEDET